MPGLLLKPKQPASIELGQIIEIQVTDAEPDLETRYFIRHEHVLYPSPITPWGTQTTFQFYPEAPGYFQIAAEWRTPDGSHGWLEQSFSVTVGVKAIGRKHFNSSIDGPSLVEIDDGTSIWSVSGWEAGLIRHWESDLMSALKNFVEPGFVIYDVGANIGVYSVYASRLVGPQGHVYAVEANPMCVYLLRCNLSAAGVDNFTILPIALSDAPGSCQFKINYGNSNLGLTEESALFGLKTGQEIQVKSLDFDSMTSSFNLRPPDLIKIDIEGAEEHAIRGMRRALVEHRPTLLLEIHGEHAARATFELLEGINYKCFFLDDLDGPPCGLEILLENSRRRVFHLVARMHVGPSNS
jgi:FkbM family methyltransferase